MLNTPQNIKVTLTFTDIASYNKLDTSMENDDMFISISIKFNKFTNTSSCHENPRSGLEGHNPAQGETVRHFVHYPLLHV